MAFFKRLFMVICLLGALLILIVVMFPQMNSTAKSNDQAAVHRQLAAKGQPVPAIDDEEIQNLTSEFMYKIVQDTTEDFKVKKFDSKDALLDDFETVASRKVAEPYVDYFFKEQADGLFIVPTETPPWFEADEPYQTKHVSNNQVIVTQQNDSVFYGTYTLTLELTYNEKWKITNVKDI